MTQPNAEVAKAVFAKGCETIAKWSEANENVKRLDEELKIATARRDAVFAEYEQVRIAARVFGLDIDDMINQAANYAASQSAEAVTGPSEAPQSIPSTPSTKPLREEVVSLAEAAYPKPVRASQLRQELETRRGTTLHEKTIGMTLYRLSRSGIIRREGQKDWYFVPPSERKEDPGDGAPGQLSLVN